MNKTKIEYGEYIWNFWVGCTGLGCAVKDQCWAEKLNRRFKWVKDFRRPQFIKKKFLESFPKRPSRILVCFTGDIMRPEVPSKLIQLAIGRCIAHPQHTFLWLTKNPKRYKQFQFPQNTWLGTTYNNKKDIGRLFDLMRNPNNIVYVSIEPMMEKLYYDDVGIGRMNWLIVGGYSNPSKIQPKKEWIENVIDVADRYHIPVWMKNNLRSVWHGEFRQEYPK